MKGSGRQRLKSSAKDQFGIWMEVFKKPTKIHAMTVGLWGLHYERHLQARSRREDCVLISVFNSKYRGAAEIVKHFKMLVTR